MRLHVNHPAPAMPSDLLSLHPRRCRAQILLILHISIIVTFASAEKYLLMGTLFWQQLTPNNRTVQFELHTAWKYVSNTDGIRECQCNGVLCGTRPSPCTCTCSGNLGFPAVGDILLSMDRFVFGDGISTSVSFTVMALDPSNDVLFAKAELSYEYSYNQTQTEFIAGFYYQNRPSDIVNDPGSEIMILSNIKASAFHMSANPADLKPNSDSLARENTKRANSPQISSALPLSFDIPIGQSHSFSFPGKVGFHQFLFHPHPHPPSPRSPLLIAPGCSHSLQKLGLFILQLQNGVPHINRAATNDNRRVHRANQHSSAACIPPGVQISHLHRRNKLFCLYHNGERLIRACFCLILGASQSAAT